MKDLQPNISDDFEHRVASAIEHHGDEDGFPQMETYGVTRGQLDDYLFDYQAILDSEGSLRAQQTTYGIIAVIPVIVFSAFPQDSLPWKSPAATVLAAVGVGVLVALGVKVIRMTMKKARLSRHRAADASITAYVDAVIHFVERQ